MHRLSSDLARAQLERVRLEVKSLRNPSKRRDSLAQLLPFISVLLATGGFLFGIYQYLNQQEKAQRIERTTYQGSVPSLQ
jgi:hypothetical protein